MTNPVLDEIISGLRVARDRLTYRKLDFFRPYPKQKVFLAMGRTVRERLLMAGNQVGKSYTGATESATHVTGDYPKDWEGRVFRKPIKMWAAGESGLVVRDVQQKLLCGEPGVEALLGSGMIPREAIAATPTLGRGVTNGYDTVQVKHLAPGGQSGIDGVSILRFKSYEQGRTKLQGESLDFFWCDEEPPEDIYAEILTRVTATDGCGILTFTPLKGMSTVVLGFLNTADATRKAVVTMTIEDAEHIPAEKRAQIIAGYPAYQREARANGVPMMGDGRVFTVPEAAIREPTIEFLPTHWTKMWTVDFGIAHPFAAVVSAWDRDADVVHITHGFRVSDQQPLQHAETMQAYAGNLPVGWPHDGNNREKGTGLTLSSQYKARGLMMLPSHITWIDGGISVEAGITEMQARMESNRFKVAEHLTDWFEEYRLYHRQNGLIVKVRDDMLDASRLAVMGRRFGKPLDLLHGKHTRPRGTGVAKDVDFDVFQ